MSPSAMRAEISGFIHKIKNPQNTKTIGKLRKLLRMLCPPSEKHMGRESKTFDGCPLCMKPNTKHYARGFCSLCYRKLKKNGIL